jgi:hypothetical protein
MIFSLEALVAFNGDCLLLHGGTADDRRLVLIDGGPTRTWGKSLKPRLDELRAAQPAPGDPLRIDLAMVSHVDDDHIGGMVAFTGELVSETGARPYEVSTLWHNSFDDVIGNIDAELRAAALASLDTPVGDRRADEIRAASRAVLATVGDGRRLRQDAETLGWQINRPFGTFVALPAEGARTIKLGPMNLTVVCPHAAQLAALDKAWEAYLKQEAKRAQAPAAAPAGVDAAPDSSPYNLSSIVVVAECQGKTMLLTGDALSDHILAGLEQAGLLQDGKAHFDIFKLPHHGSERNTTQAFFDAITADHYVISANGHDGNPDFNTLHKIAASRRDDDFEIHLTNDVDDNDSLKDLVDHVNEFRAERATEHRTFGVTARKDPALSLRIDLLDEG